MNTIFCSQGHESPGGQRFCQVCGEKLSPPAASLLVAGTVLEGRYRIVQQIGQGGFGRTYLCENLNRFKEPCVLKEFAPQVQGTYALEKAKKLFEREANVLHQLAHPQIPRFRELFQLSGGGLFLVQDYVAGQTYRYLLAQRITQNQLFSVEEVRQLLRNLLPVLDYIHSIGVIHRDIAPDNLILRSSDQMPVLIDFGGVKQVAVNAEIQVTGSTDLPTCLGKAGYAPHEQLQRGTVYPHSDIYALAATALVLLTGREPMDMIEPLNLNWNWRQFVTLDPDFGAVLDKMLHPNPASRFQSAKEALAALEKSSPVIARGSQKTMGTVVVAPNPVRKNPYAGTAAIATGDDGEFWPILRRSWLGILAVAVLGGGAWAAMKFFAPSSISNPAPSPSVLPTTQISPETGTSESPSATPTTPTTTDTETNDKQSSDSQVESPVSPRSVDASASRRSRQAQDTESGSSDRSERRSRKSQRNRESADPSAKPRSSTRSTHSPKESSTAPTGQESTKPSRSSTPTNTTKKPSPEASSQEPKVNPQPASELPELVPSKTPETSTRPSKSSSNRRSSTSPDKERTAPPKESTTPEKPKESKEPVADPLF